MPGAPARTTDPAPARRQRQRVKREPVRGYPGISKLHRAKGDVYEVRWRANGTGYSATFPKLTEAKAHLVAQQHAVHHGEFIQPAAKRTTFGELAEQWLTSYPRKATTIKGYQKTLTTWLAPWKTRPVGSLGYRDAVAVFAAMRQADRRGQTLRNVYTVMKGVFDHAVRQGHLSANPVAGHRKYLILVDEEPFENTIIDENQVVALVEALPAPYGLLALSAAWSGLRRGEFQGLRVRNLDTLRRRVRVAETVQWSDSTTWYVETPKSATSRRTVPQIPPAIMADLQALIDERGLGPDDWLFGEEGRPLNWNDFYRSFKRAARDVLGLPSLRPHDLRGTFASLMAEELGLFATSRRLGHSSVKVTERHYARVFERDDQESDDRIAAREAAARARRGSTGVTPLRAVP